MDRIRQIEVVAIASLFLQWSLQQIDYSTHGKAWMDHEEVCAWEWRLGIHKTESEISEVGSGKFTEKETHDCRVTLDPISHRVIDWKLMVETTRHPVNREINSLDSKAIIPPALEVERI